MKIKEIQYFKTNPDDAQCRIIKINSWYEYAKQFDNSKFDKTSSIPRCSKILELCLEDEYLECEFINTFLNSTIVHVAFVVNENSEVGIIKKYKNTLINRNNNFSKVLNGYNNNEIKFKKEYESKWIKD